MPSATPLLAFDRCLNAGLDAQGRCRRCVDVCPAQAIAIERGQPQLDPARCTGCTACVAVCPTDAWCAEHFDPEQTTHAVLRAAVAAAEGGRRIDVACAGADDETTADPAIPCHAGWTLAAMLALAAVGIERVRCIGADRCEGCPRRHGRAALDALEAALQPWLRATGLRLTIEIAAEASGRDAPPARRAFFRRLLPAITGAARLVAAEAQAALRAEAADEDEDRNGDRGHEADAAPASWRLALLRWALEQGRPNFTPIPVSPYAPIGAIQADASCNGCGECVPACPTAAITLRPYGTARILELHPAVCLGCARCVAVCPQRALSVLPTLSAPGIVAGGTRPLALIDRREGHDG